MINAWMLYRRVRQQMEKRRLEQQADSQVHHGSLSLHEFVCDVAACLTKSGVQRRSQGRPNNVEADIAYKRKRAGAAPLPPSDVRLDNVGHLPVHDDGRNRCKMPKCESRSRTMCTKCKVHLCLSAERNCFMDFHTN